MLTSFTIHLPDWLQIDERRPYGGIEARMQLAISLAARNVAEKTGGPFGAAVFDEDSGALLGLGVNRVLDSACSVAHAEVVAISLAQQAHAVHDLSVVSRAQLVTSAEPCMMCIGAAHWSGIRSIVYGARDEDVRSIGFDEGMKPQHWHEALEARGIRMLPDVCRESAKAVLSAYAASGGTIYNTGLGRGP